jgi:N-acetylmuramic acid 6-phosphate (MurNAc-6-P) etherase
MLGTAAMARLGYVYGNLMVNLRYKNKKLFERAVSIVEDVAGVNREVAARTLKAAGLQVPVARVMRKANLSKRKPRAASSAPKASSQGAEGLI